MDSASPLLSVCQFAHLSVCLSVYICRHRHTVFCHKHVRPVFDAINPSSPLASTTPLSLQDAQIHEFPAASGHHPRHVRLSVARESVLLLNDLVASVLAAPHDALVAKMTSRCLSSAFESSAFYCPCWGVHSAFLAVRRYSIGFSFQ